MQMNISELWDRLDPDTQKWLRDNPGCRTLPRTLSAKVSAATGAPVECDQHGQIVLSEEDGDFLRAKAAGAPADTTGQVG